jgi:hypothetical protein
MRREAAVRAYEVLVDRSQLSEAEVGRRVAAVVGGSRRGTDYCWVVLADARQANALAGCPGVLGLSLFPGPVPPGPGEEARA